MARKRISTRLAGELFGPVTGHQRASDCLQSLSYSVDSELRGRRIPTGRELEY